MSKWIYRFHNSLRGSLRNRCKNESRGGGILGDPGEVSRVGRKDGTNFFKYGRKSPWVPDSHRTISKNSSGYRLLIGHKKCFVLLCSIGEQFLLSSFRESYTSKTIVKASKLDNFWKIIKEYSQRTKKQTDKDKDTVHMWVEFQPCSPARRLTL